MATQNGYAFFKKSSSKWFKIFSMRLTISWALIDKMLIFSKIFDLLFAHRLKPIRHRVLSKVIVIVNIVPKHSIWRE